MRNVLRSVCVLGTLLTPVGCGSAPLPGLVASGPDAVEIPSIPVARARMPDGPIPAILRLPEGNGSFPAVIVLHGCGGRGNSQLDWARRLNGWGYAALIPDSLTPRGVRSVCDPADQPRVTSRDRAGDVMAAATWLRTQPRIDPARIAVLGQSHGGATAAVATQRAYEGFGLRAAVDYYGQCGDAGLHGRTPLLALAGEADDWGHPAARCRTYEMSFRPGQTMELHTYPGVQHGFENARLTRRSVRFGHIMDYDRDAAEDSFVRVRTFLDRWVKS